MGYFVPGRDGWWLVVDGWLVGWSGGWLVWWLLVVGLVVCLVGGWFVCGWWFPCTGYVAPGRDGCFFHDDDDDDDADGGSGGALGGSGAALGGSGGAPGGLGRALGGLGRALGGPWDNKPPHVRYMYIRGNSIAGTPLTSVCVELAWRRAPVALYLWLI